MKILEAKYVKGDGGETVAITAKLEDKDYDICVPIALGNTDYIEIMRQVDAGELTIEPADE